jgi:iron-sulfur cluster insertion protein
MSQIESTEPGVALSASAARRLHHLIRAEGNPALMLRLSVSAGEEDRVFERDGVKLVVDEVSLSLLGGAEVDYIEELVGSSFQVRNPNAKSSCGCGSSFAV